jgi:tetratricopeptide (TPR) repeat protein
MLVSQVEDAFYRYDGNLLEMSNQALGEAPSSRLHVIRAVAGRVFGLPIDRSKEFAAARELAVEPSEWSLLSAVEVFVGLGPAGAAEGLVEHSLSFPDDLLGGLLRYSALIMSGVPGNRARAVGLVESDAGRLGGNWRFDSLLAMVREEQRRYDEARALAERTLAEQPDNAPAAHVLAHVNYETGEHKAGITWLDEWSSNRSMLFYGTHFPWHNALHALALGDIDAAMERFHQQIGPGELIDAGSLLWRCHLAGTNVHQEGLEAAAAARSVVNSLPTPFVVFNACLALAAAGDADTLGSLINRLELDERPAFADLISPIAKSLLAMVEGRPDDAVTLLVPLEGDVPRLGGSDAQREVVEDTLLRALVAAEQFERAERLLRSRLQRRSHALDNQLLELALVG